CAWTGLLSNYQCMLTHCVSGHSIKFMFEIEPCLYSWCADVTLAMTVTSSGPQTLQVAQGEQATLNCIYSPDPEDMGELDIEWVLVCPDTTRKDQVIISYSGSHKYFHGDPSFMNAVDFLASDPVQGDASLVIGSVTVTHAGTYQCKVKKAPGVDMQKLSLVVMERPSVPKCWVEGNEAVGKPVSLHCKSDEGSAPLQYVWKRESGGPLPPSVNPNSFLGELLIYNYSMDWAGTYSCEVANAVGKQYCRVNLQVIKSPNRAGVIAGTVSGCLLLIIIILIVIWLIVFRWERKQYDVFAMSFREDAPAPNNRSTSRGPSSGVAYSQMSQTHKKQSPSSSTSYITQSYIKSDSKYGHIV
uniref:V-set and immunoglobulin domain containing 8a n=1 Tax=Electrophorus electricus TaxID=8005 RepID=A0A4W4FK47_ELEEL